MRWLWNALTRPLTSLHASFAPSSSSNSNGGKLQRTPSRPARRRPSSAPASASSSGDSYVTAKSVGRVGAGEEEAESWFSPDERIRARRGRRRATASTAGDERESPSTSTTSTASTSSRRTGARRKGAASTGATRKSGVDAIAPAPPPPPSSTVVVVLSSGSSDGEGDGEKGPRGTAARRTLFSRGEGEGGERRREREPPSTLPSLAAALPTATTSRGRRKKSTATAATADSLPSQGEEEEGRDREPLSTLPSLAAALPLPRDAATTRRPPTTRRRTTSAAPPLPDLRSLVLTPVRGGRTTDGGEDPYSLPATPSNSNPPPRGDGDGDDDGVDVVEVGDGETSSGDDEVEDAGDSQVLVSSSDSEREDSDGSEWRPRSGGGKENDESDGDDSSPSSSSSLPSTHTALAAPAPPRSAAAFRRVRAARAAELYSKFNSKAFDDRLPKDVAVLWSARLRTTAGLTHFTRLKGRKGEKAAPTTTNELYVEGRGARIELSGKVVDSEGRLAATLLHEMCHVAAWCLDGQARPPHGAAFQRWAARAARSLPGVPSVKTCHSYRVHAPHAWRCVGHGSKSASSSAAAASALLNSNSDDRDGSGCGQVYRRHSRSIDSARHACGVCKGRLLYVGKLAPDGKPLSLSPANKRDRGPATPSANGFAAFVARRFAAVKREAPRGASHGEVMRMLAAEWRREKEAREAAR